MREYYDLGTVLAGLSPQGRIKERARADDRAGG
jgi:hypothetical protein